MVKALYITLSTILLLYISSYTVSSQRCTTTFFDPRSVSNYDLSRLVPLPSLNADIQVSEQWIFPDLKFTCYKRVTTWIFTAVSGPTGAPCMIEIETWWLRTISNTSSTIYDRISSTTETRLSDIIITQDGLILSYELTLERQCGKAVHEGTQILCLYCTLEFGNSVLRTLAGITSYEKSLIIYPLYNVMHN